jgi:hypothetical protein
MINVLNVILVCLIKRPSSTCCVGSLSAHLRNSQMVEFDSSSSLQFKRLTSSQICSLTLIQHLTCKAVRQPIDQQLVSRCIVTANHQHSLQALLNRSPCYPIYLAYIHTLDDYSTFPLISCSYLFVITLRGRWSKPCWQLFM